MGNIMQIAASKRIKIFAAMVAIVPIAFCFWLLRPLPPPVPKKAPVPPVPKRVPCNDKQAKEYGEALKIIAAQEKIRARKDESLESRQAAWLMAKAQYALTKSGIFQPKNILDDAKRNLLEDTYNMLVRACHQSRNGVKEIQEERGSRLRAYISNIDQTIQTYSISVPANYDPSIKWPLIVSMHGHGWYAPFQGHPAPSYPGVFCLSPQGRGATDYKDIGENDVMTAIEEVKKDFSIDLNRIYLTGSSMGGTGTFHLATRYADNFAAIMPIVANADNEAWTERWGWNKRFPGRYDDLRKWIQDGHTARAFAENLLHLPAFVIAGAADIVVPTAHSRNMVRLLRSFQANVQYREFPGCGHGGFPKEALADALAWTCSWERNPYPSTIFWKADQIKYGKSYWLRMEQFAKPLVTGYFSASVVSKNQINIQTYNLLSFSFQRPPQLLEQSKELKITVDGKELQLTSLPEKWDAWVTLRKDPTHGWLDQRDTPLPGLIKTKGLEGPINEAINAPFILVVGSISSNPEMNDAWLREAKTFSSEWKRRNNESCLMIYDTQCTPEIMKQRNLILFGGESDNKISQLIYKNIPVSDIMACLHENDKNPLEGGHKLDAPDLGSLILYPNTEYAQDKMVVMLSANAPEAAFQLWGRFGNWFNWGVYDSKKYFDYAVFDSRSCSPETMLLLGWFGTDWRVDSGKYFTGDKNLRDTAAPQCYPPFTAPPDSETLSLSELMPSKIDQMRGALGFGRGFFGENLGNPGSLGMRAPCILEYKLDGQFNAFTSTVTLRNSPETNMCQQREKGEAVRFTVFGDGKKIKERIVTWKKPQAHVAADLTGVKVLKLECVPSSGPSWLHSGAAWLEPVLWKKGAPEELKNLSALDETPAK